MNFLSLSFNSCQKFAIYKPILLKTERLFTKNNLGIDEDPVTWIRYSMIEIGSYGFVYDK
jgi:hypothetical protein